MNIDRELLIRIDSACSLVAHRGLDEEARQELLDIGLACRRIYETGEHLVATNPGGPT